MKIIKEPTYDKRIICNLCKCEFEFEIDDLEKVVIAKRGDGEDIFRLTVQCPFCLNKIDVTNRMIKN